MRERYDVLVIGGGTAGVVAAVQAARAGANTLLVEKNGMLGGTITVGGINAPAHFFAWGRQVIAGIGWELMRRTLQETGQEVPSPAFTRDQPRVPHLTMDPFVFAAVCDAAVLEAGVELLLHAMPAEVAFTEGSWQVRICTKGGLHATRAKVLIDATGDANVVQMAGFDVNHPEVVQPATLQMRCGGYDPDSLDYAALHAACRQAIAERRLMSTDVSWGDNGPEAFLKRFGANANHVRAPHADDSPGRTRAEVAARQAVLRMYRFFRAQPGLENFRVEAICPEVGIRETVTIRGKATVTTVDYEAGRVYDDAICYAFYPIDEHLNDGQGINYRLLRSGVLATIPRGAILPEGSRFLLAPGRCVSSEREANSALRVQCPCMAMGQAAGGIAALSARAGVDAPALPMSDIRDLLAHHGAIVPGA